MCLAIIAVNTAHPLTERYGKHLGHARFDTNSAPPTNAEYKDPCHRTKDYHLGRAPNRLRNFDITMGLSTEHTMQVHLESCKLHTFYAMIINCNIHGNLC